MKGKNAIIGSIGEFYAAAKLSEKGWTVTLTSKNHPNIDILVTDGINTKAVQVKTSANSKADWVCSLPKTTSPDLVYIFVVLNTKAETIPDFYIVPSKDTAKIIKRIDDEYKKKNPDKPPIKGVSKIWFKTEAEGKPYKNNWNNIGLANPSGA